MKTRTDCRTVGTHVGEHYCIVGVIVQRVDGGSALGQKITIGFYRLGEIGPLPVVPAKCCVVKGKEYLCVLSVEPGTCTIPSLAQLDGPDRF